MKFINYIKSFKDFIPTWIICIFMFFGIFGWTFVIGFILMIIQCFQRRNVKKSMNKAINIEQIDNAQEQYEMMVHQLQDTLIQKDNELSALKSIADGKLHKEEVENLKK